MYELIVIGGGPGGCAAALRAAQGGLSVVLFEPRQVGGTCLNRGCVPTKALLHGAGPGCDWPALAAEVERVVSTPVSYTHLDVYKRQPQRHLLRMRLW